MNFPPIRRIIYNLSCVFINKNSLIGMCPSRPNNTEMETPYFFLQFLYIWISMCSCLIYNLYKLKFDRTGEERALFWVEKQCLSSLTQSLNFSLWVKKNIASKQIAMVITSRLYKYVLDRNLDFPIQSPASPSSFSTTQRDTISPARGTCYIVMIVIALEIEWGD